jgi:prepilin signal peptidase PulO-like enzyme (type II secretory pathway)
MNRQHEARRTDNFEPVSNGITMVSNKYRRDRRQGWFREMFDRPWRILVGLVGLIGIATALFLLLRPSSDIRTLGLPNWKIFRWVDEHGEFRNTPSFAVLAVPFLLLARGRRQRRIVITWLAIFVAVTEFGQLGIKTRYFDTNDILLGWLGLTCSWGVMELIAWRQRVKYRRYRSGAGRLLLAVPKPEIIQ